MLNGLDGLGELDGVNGVNVSIGQGSLTSMRRKQVTHVAYTSHQHAWQ
jgi:hypothetical protein